MEETYDELAAKLVEKVRQIRALEEENSTLRAMLDELEKLRRTVKLVDEMFPEFYETRGRSQTMTAHLLSQV